MRGLFLRIGLRHHRARFAEAEAQLAKEPLALPRLQFHPQLPRQIARERFAIPNPAASHARCAWTLPQGDLHLRQLRRTQARRPASAFPFSQASQASRFKPMHPILHRARRVPQHACGLAATQPLGDQENTMQAVIIARLIRTTNLILERGDHRLSVCNLQWLHP